MKKKIVLAMAIIMVLGSVKAMAEDIGNDIEFGQNMIRATEDMHQRLDEEEFYQDEVYKQLQMDKVSAAEADRLEQLSNEVQAKLAKISGLKDSSQPNLNKAIKATVQQAESLHREFKASHNIQKLQKLSADLEDRWQTLNEMDQKNPIQGVRVHPELRY